MICDLEDENKVKKYAKLNNYTILADRLGYIEYVKYTNCNLGSSPVFLKWPKGSHQLILTKEGIVEKISLSDIVK